MRWERLTKVAAGALVCVLAACGGGGGDTPAAGAQGALKAGPPPGLVGNDPACAAILGKGKGSPPAHVREACGSGALPLPAPTGLTVGYATKSYSFQWSPVAAPDFVRYELLEDPDGAAGPLAAATVASSSTTAVTLRLGLLHERVNAEYAVRVCSTGGCGPASASVRPDVTRAAGALKASNPGATDNFGAAVAVSADGSTLVVGAPFEDSAGSLLGANPADDSLPGAGAAYVFTRGATGWVQEAYVKSSHPGLDARFGSALALSDDGSTLAVGASTDPLQGIQAGSVDVFVRAAGSWSHQAYLQAGNPGRLHQFGSSLALSADGNTLAVGAPTENNPAAGTLPPNPVGATSPVGAVYVFTRSGSAWTQQAHVKNPQPVLGDSFGRSVALSADGNTMAVGMPGRRIVATGSSSTGTGATHVFTRSAGTWSPQALLTASNPAVAGAFGLAVALSGDGGTLAVGAPQEQGASRGVGGSQADGQLFAAGAAYVFVRGAAGWTQQAYVKPHNTDSSDGFGSSVSLSGDGNTLAVGAPNEDGSARWFGSTGADDNLVLNAGAAYVYRRDGSAWSQAGFLKPGNEQREFALFGGALALSRDAGALVVGAGWESSSGHLAGAAYLF